MKRNFLWAGILAILVSCERAPETKTPDTERANTAASPSLPQSRITPVYIAPKETPRYIPPKETPRYIPPKSTPLFIPYTAAEKERMEKTDPGGGE